MKKKKRKPSSVRSDFKPPSAYQRNRRIRKPDIFTYHDYRTFLKDWIDYRREAEPGFTAQKLAQQAGLATGYLTMVISGARSLTEKALLKFAKYLGIPEQEAHYLELLRRVAESGRQQERLEAMEEIIQTRAYQKKNPKEMEVFQYLTRWYYVAIREMSCLPGFKWDADWIQDHLVQKVPIKEVREAMDFLVENGYVEVSKSGVVTPPARELNCFGGVYKIALSQYLKEMFSLGAEAIDSVPRERRTSKTYVLPAPEERFDDIRRILEETYEKIAALREGNENSDTVYFVGLTSYPLFKK